MKALKSAIFTLLILIGLLSGYMVFKFDSKYLLKLTAEAYESRDYSRADEFLTKLKKKPTPQVNLYEGYLCRAQKKSEASTQAFQRALETAHEERISHEASFNLLVNAYEREDYEFIQSHLKKFNFSESFSHFFSALLSYHQKDYSRAYDQFIESEERNYYSKWMRQTWEDIFPKNFEISRIAHCLIEIGKPHQGRLLLEKHLNKFDGDRQTFSYYMGLSFLKAVSMSSMELAPSYLSKSAPYLKQLSLWKNPEQKEVISSYLENYLKQILSQKSYTHLKDALSLTCELSLFDQNLSILLLKQLEVEKRLLPKGEFLAYLNVLELLSKQNELFESYFSNYCRRSLEHLIEQKQIPLLKEIAKPLWSASRPNAREELTHFVQEHIQKSFADAQDPFEETYELFLFWDQIERDDQNRLRFLQMLVSDVEKLWPINSSKALEFAKTLDQFSHASQKPVIQQAMLDMLQEVCADLNTPDSQEAYLYFNPLISR